MPCDETRYLHIGLVLAQRRLQALVQPNAAAGAPAFSRPLFGWNGALLRAMQDSFAHLSAAACCSALSAACSFVRSACGTPARYSCSFTGLFWRIQGSFGEIEALFGDTRALLEKSGLFWIFQGSVTAAPAAHQRVTFTAAAARSSGSFRGSFGGIRALLEISGRSFAAAAASSTCSRPSSSRPLPFSASSCARSKSFSAVRSAIFPRSAMISSRSSAPSRTCMRNAPQVLRKQSAVCHRVWGWVLRKQSAVIWHHPYRVRSGSSTVSSPRSSAPSRTRAHTHMRTSTPYKHPLARLRAPQRRPFSSRKALLKSPTIGK
jgi:hypothetical protein